MAKKTPVTITDDIKVDEIITTAGTQARVSINADTVSDYAEELQRGTEFPPVDVFTDGTSCWLADGFHRHHAHETIGCDTIRATVHTGTLRDAVLFAVKANAQHGLHRSNEDKRHCVAMLLADDEWVKRSDRWIAEECHVSQPFVGTVRREIEQATDNVISSIGRTGKDGKVRLSGGNPTDQTTVSPPQYVSPKNLDPHPEYADIYGPLVESLDEGMLASVLEDGVTEPIAVCLVGDRLRILSGHRRWAAAMWNELDLVPITTWQGGVDIELQIKLMVDANQHDPRRAEIGASYLADMEETKTDDIPPQRETGEPMSEQAFRDGWNAILAKEKAQAFIELGELIGKLNPPRGFIDLHVAIIHAEHRPI